MSRKLIQQRVVKKIKLYIYMFVLENSGEIVDFRLFRKFGTGVYKKLNQRRMKMVKAEMFFVRRQTWENN